MISVSGQGLSGRACCHVSLNSEGGKAQTTFIWNDHAFSLPPDHLRTERTTILAWNSFFLRTPEHLLAARVLWPDQGLRVLVSEGELPILDGSAWPWVQSFFQLWKNTTPVLKFRCTDYQDQWEWSEGAFCAQPSASGLHIHYVMDREDWTDAVDVHLEQAEDLYPVLQSRTFITQEQWQQARAQGLLQGAQEGHGLLLQPQGRGKSPLLLVGAPLRHAQEPLLHKVLDLVGDLAILGPYLPKLKISVRNGGHWIHHQFVKRLQAYGYH